MKTLAGRPLKIGVEGDELVIRIGLDTLKFSFETGDENNPFDNDANDFRRSFRVTDKHMFARGVANALTDERGDGSTPITDILDKAYLDAVEGDYGVDEDNRLVTKQMTKYHGA